MALPDPGLDVKTDEQRETIVFGRPIEWGKETLGQFARISPLEDIGPDYITPKTFRRLIDNGYIDPNGTQNASPTMERLCDLGERLESKDTVDHVEYTGYMVGPKRPDARITLTGITVVGLDKDNMPPLSDEVQQTFTDVCQQADEFTADPYMCNAWWD